MRLIFITILLILVYYTSRCQSFYFEIGDTLTVISKSGANLRDSNSISSTKISSLPFGSKVIARQTKCCIYFEREFYDNRYGSWISVEHDGINGYLFSGFLTKLKIPSIDLETLDCYDTRIFEKILRANADSLTCQGVKQYKGFDEDGKDWRNSKWEMFNNETKINQIYGYEWRELIMESTVLTMNDVLNLCEYFLEKLKGHCDANWYWQQEDEYKQGINFVKDGDYIVKLYCGGLGITAEKLSYKTMIREFRN